jgi:hypothetical protein
MRLVIVGSIAASVGVALAACGGSESGVGTPSDDGGGTPEGSTGDESTTTPPTTPPGTDAGDDGGDITDGGSNFDPDAGDDGGLPDGGKCNTLDNNAAAITSTCVSKRPILAGGALVAGKYFLTAVRDLGTKPFCTTTFIPTGFKETLDLTVSGTTATAETVTAIGGVAAGRHATTTFTTNAGNISPMQGQQTCPVVGAGGLVPYEVTIPAATGKVTLVVILPYGKGEAIYTYEKQP